MKQVYKKYNKLFIILVLTILSFLYIKRDKGPEYEFSAPVNVEIHSEEERPVEEIEDLAKVTYLDVAPEGEPPKKVPIYVCGEVQNPDVYYLYETNIVKEAIMAAGGFTSEANQEAWNLAMQIQKGVKIDVPKVGEQIDKTDNSYDNSTRDINAPNKIDQLININQAGTPELTSLSGIGPVTAKNIIEFRNTNGEFKSLQDVNNVPGIGQVTLDKIKDHICFQ